MTDRYLVTLQRRCVKCTFVVFSTDQHGVCLGCRKRALTPAQRRVYGAVVHLVRFAYPPTEQEIADEVGLVRSTAHYHLVALREMHLVTWRDGQQRTITLDR